MGCAVAISFTRRMVFQLPPFLSLKAGKSWMPAASRSCCSKTREEHLWFMCTLAEQDSEDKQKHLTV